MNPSKRVQAMQASPIRKLIPLSLAAKKRGIHVYHLNIGQPDIPTPKEFFEAIRDFGGKVLKYQLSGGDPDLIHAIKTYFERENIFFDEEDIIITNGGSEALSFALQAICDVGENVLVPEPFYTNYNGFTHQVGVFVKPITTKAEGNFHLPAKEEIVKMIDKNTKAILYSNPGNPTGVVYTEAEIRLLCDIAKEYDLMIISDEVYRKMTFDGKVSISLGTFQDVADRAVIIESVSKRFSSCGARIGSIQSKNKVLMKEVLKLAQARLSVSTIDQVGATALYALDEEYVLSIRDEYKDRRDAVLAGLAKIDGVEYRIPSGAFYCIVTLPVEDAEDFCAWLLSDFSYEKETIMLAPVRDFYVNKELGKKQVRIAYVLGASQMSRSMDLLKIALEQYTNK
ncbi:MAG: pyridoxal phosphate-dependent aminotransferase [Candidatus Izemoplasmatales bacterium]|nr:pyridoxal phosphate-dependent aminotransferase [Candidatus Izemoplasmatales bacterium]